MKISTTTPDDARWIQTVTVKPNTNYRVSGWIKTQNVVPENANSGSAGANLSIYGTWTHSPGLLGTQNWTYVTVDFNSGNSSQAQIAVRLGYWSDTVTGTAWYDDVKIDQLN